LRFNARMAALTRRRYPERPDLFAQIIVVKGNPGFAREIDQRDTERNQRSHEQKRHTIFVRDMVEGANECDDDNERSENRREDRAEQRSI
jgi:hypothetical protein